MEVAILALEGVELVVAAQVEVALELEEEE